MEKFLKKAIYLLGPLLFVLVLFYPTALEVQTQRFLAIFVMVVFLWMFTDIPLFVSGILGVSLSILIGVVTPAQAFAPFSDPIIYLFLSGFLFAKALELTELDQRLAYKVLSLKGVQDSPHKIVLAFLSLSFVLSMWISNTAAVAMLLPLSLGLIKRLETGFGIKSENFKEQFLLALAYSATLGGNVTPIGSPPNVIAIGLLRNLLDIHLGFLEWMALAAPFSLILFYFVYKQCVATLPAYKEKVTQHIEEEVRPLSREQKHVLVIFGLAVFFWVSPSIVLLFLEVDSALAEFLQRNLTAPVVGLIFASMLFLFPLNSLDKLLKGHHTSQIDWPSLLLFGAGLSLGAILFKTGLAKIFADYLAMLAGDFGPISILIVLILATIFFTELASNTASANILIPIMIAFAVEMSFSPMLVAVAFALACNSAFMLPVATPPNVIVYGTQLVTKGGMFRAGFKFNMLGFAVLAVALAIFA